MARLRQIFGANLCQRRKLRGWTQPQLAERANLSIDMIGRLERGAAGPSLETIEALCRALDVPATALFGGPEGQKASGRRAELLEQIALNLSKANDEDLRRIEWNIIGGHTASSGEQISAAIGEARADRCRITSAPAPSE